MGRGPVDINIHEDIERYGYAILGYAEGLETERDCQSSPRCGSRSP